MSQMLKNNMNKSDKSQSPDNTDLKLLAVSNPQTEIQLYQQHMRDNRMESH